MCSGLMSAETARSSLEDAINTELSIIRGLQGEMAEDINNDLSTAISDMQTVLDKTHANTSISLGTLLIAVADLQTNKASAVAVSSSISSVQSNLTTLITTTTSSLKTNFTSADNALQAQIDAIKNANVINKPYTTG